jgi:hypothetical protein
LLIGFAAGFLTNGYLTRHKVERLRNFMEQPESFEDRLIGDLELPDSTADAVRPILLDHFQRMCNLHRGFRQDMRQQFATLREALTPHLDEQQLQKLRRNLQRRGPDDSPGPSRRHRRGASRQPSEK